MAATSDATDQYATGATRERIERALGDAGRSPAELTLDDLALLEDFHSLGRLATRALVELAAVTATDRVLDAGSGIGGTARYLAHERGCAVVAIDLTPEYCEANAWLNGLLGLDRLIEVRTASVLQIPAEDASFDAVFSQHVQMNIADKYGLYREAARVLRPGGRLALWDVTAGPEQPLHFPEPWADTPERSHLVTPEALQEHLAGAGFEATVWNDLTEPSIAFFRAILAAPPPPLGLGVFVPNFAEKAANLLRSLEEDRARLIQAVLVRAG
jgi:SAM-dependent methyltransferase